MRNKTDTKVRTLKTQFYFKAIRKREKGIWNIKSLIPRDYFFFILNTESIPRDQPVGHNLLSYSSKIFSTAFYLSCWVFSTLCLLSCLLTLCISLLAPRTGPPNLLENKLLNYILFFLSFCPCCFETVTIVSMKHF